MRCWYAIFSIALWWHRICKVNGLSMSAPVLDCLAFHSLSCVLKPISLCWIALVNHLSFLRQVQHELKLENIEPVQSRVEEFPSEPPFDGVISRAFASLNDMVSWCHHLPGEQGRFYALKGQMPEDENGFVAEEYQVESVVKLQVPALDGERHLVVIKANKI